MRLGLIGFVAGCVALQMQATLPPVWLPLGVLVLCLSLAAVTRRRPMLFPVLFVASTIAVGFGWSGWRAQQRLAVALSPAWEGKDIIATGVVAELPQTGDEATRFLFHIESSNAGDAVPPRVRLSWYGTRNWGSVGEEGAKPDRRAGMPDLQPGQRWQLTLERQPVAFLDSRRGMAPLLTVARRALAEELGTSEQNVAMVSNATTGLNVVAHSLALGPDDEILTTDHEYAALAKQAGCAPYLRSPTPGVRQPFIDALADLILEHAGTSR